MNIHDSEDDVKNYAIATFMYKCRMCGQIFGDQEINNIHAERVLICSLYDVVHPSGKVHKLCIHVCDKTKTGVADLVGYECKEILRLKKE